MHAVITVAVKEALCAFRTRSLATLCISRAPNTVWYLLLSHFLDKKKNEIPLKNRSPSPFPRDLLKYLDPQIGLKHLLLLSHGHLGDSSTFEQMVPGTLKKKKI